MRIRLRVRTAVYGAPSSASQVVAELEKGTEVEAGKVQRLFGRDWAPVLLMDGSKGYIDGKAEWFALKTMRIVQPGGADLCASPDPDASVLRRLARGEKILSLDLIEREDGFWRRVRDRRGIEGFIAGETLLQERTAGPLDALLRGAGILLAVGVLGAGFLFVRGESLAALALLTVCAVGGGLGGLVFWLVRPLRASVFGTHLAWMLILDTYLIAAGICFWLLGGTEELSEPLLWAVLAVVGIVGGLFCGYAILYERFEQGRHIPPAAWLVPLPAAAGLMLFGIGSCLLLLYQRDWLLFSHTQAQPADITLKDLLRDGAPEDNHYIRLKGFLHCQIGATVKEQHHGSVISTYQWVPVVPAFGLPPDLSRLVSHRPKVPRYVLAVIVHRDTDLKKQSDITVGSLSQDSDDFAAVRLERNGYVGVVLNGVKDIPFEQLEKLKELAPETDLDDVLVIDATVPLIPTEIMEQRLDYGRAGLTAGSVLLIAAVAWGWTAASSLRNRDSINPLQAKNN